LSSIQSGSSCTTQCNSGYQPNVSSLVCSLGILNPPGFTCAAQSCTAPTPNNAASPSCTEGSSISHGQSCTAECIIGHQPSVSTLSCSAGVLVPSTFTCSEEPCAAPTGIAHATAVACTAGATITSGSSCTSQCESGYTPSEGTLSCFQGNLTPSTFACSPSSCPAPNGVQHCASPACAEEQVLSNMQAHAHLLVRLGTHHHLRLFNVAMEFFPRMILFVDPQPAVPPL